MATLRTQSRLWQSAGILALCLAGLWLMGHLSGFLAAPIPTGPRVSAQYIVGNPIDGYQVERKPPRVTWATGTTQVPLPPIQIFQRTDVSTVRLPYSVVEFKHPCLYIRMDPASTIDATQVARAVRVAINNGDLPADWSVLAGVDWSNVQSPLSLGPSLWTWDFSGIAASVLFIALPCFGVFALWKARRVRRLMANLCKECEYDLTGVKADVCPECGSMHLARAS